MSRSGNSGGGIEDACGPLENNHQGLQPSTNSREPQCVTRKRKSTKIVRKKLVIVQVLASSKVNNQVKQ